MKRTTSIILLFCFTLAMFIPNHTVYTAKSEYYTEDFDTVTHNELSENWFEKSAFGTTEWPDRIVTDPSNSANKVYKMVWNDQSPQLLKWNKSLLSYNLSVDVKGGTNNPEIFNGQRSNPSSVNLRTTMENLGKPEYDSKDTLETVFGHAGVIFTLRNTWVSVEVKNESNTYADANGNENGNWFYFKDIGNNCYNNFNNLQVADDGNIMSIFWNNSLLITIQMSNIEEVIYPKGSAYFYTKAIVRNAEGNVLSTINDARIAASSDATIAFSARSSALYVDNIYLNPKFKYPIYEEDFTSVTYDELDNYWTEKNVFGKPESQLAERIISDNGDNIYHLSWGNNLLTQLLKWDYSLPTYEFEADVKGGGSYPTFEGTRPNSASIYLRTTRKNLKVPEYEVDGDINIVGHAGVVFTLRDSWISLEVKKSDNLYTDKGANRNWFYFSGKGNNCNTNFTNLHVTDDGHTMTIYWNNELLVTIEMSEIQTITYDKGSAKFYTKAIVKNAAGTVLGTIPDARIAAAEDTTIAFSVRAQTLDIDNIRLDTNYVPAPKLAPLENASYEGSQIRTTLIPYRNKAGEIKTDDMRQGLRFCFNIANIGDTFVYDSITYTIKDEGALIILKDNLLSNDLMTLSQVGRIPGLLKQDSLIDVTSEGTQYKSSYIYNIPKANKDSIICSRAYLECEDANGNTVFFYTDVQEKSLTNVFDLITDTSSFDTTVLAWWA